MRCRRPTSVCYCAAITQIPTTTRVVILQHPRERDMPIGTARMASLCLPNCELHVGVRWDEPRWGEQAILLYPGPGARDILREPPPGPITLVVVDGTWSQAKTVVRDNPLLHALPRYGFATPEPSHYRIRKEPRAEYVSTIEALMHVLGALEGKPDAFRALLAPFHAMVDAQLAAQAARPQRRYRQPRTPRPFVERLPSAFTDRYADLVLVAGEANAWPYDKSQGKRTPRMTTRDELVHWVAIRPATGERFEQLAAPSDEVSPSTAFHARITADQLASASSASALVDAFARFLRPTDIVGAWGHYATNLFKAAGGELPELIDLRGVAQRLTNKKLGGIEPFAAGLEFARRVPEGQAEGQVEGRARANSNGEIDLHAPIGDGRAGVRLAALAQIVEYFRQRA